MTDSSTTEGRYLTIAHRLANTMANTKRIWMNQKAFTKLNPLHPELPILNLFITRYNKNTVVLTG